MQSIAQHKQFQRVTLPLLTLLLLSGCLTHLRSKHELMYGSWRELKHQWGGFVGGGIVNMDTVPQQHTFLLSREDTARYDVDDSLVRVEHFKFLKVAELEDSIDIVATAVVDPDASKAQHRDSTNLIMYFMFTYSFYGNDTLWIRGYGPEGGRIMYVRIR